MLDLAITSNSLTKGCIFSLLALISVTPQAESRTKAATNIISSKPAQTSETVWVAEQQSKYIGNTKLYIASDAVKLVLQDGEVTIIGQGPDWNVVVYRPKEQIGYFQTYSQIKEKGLPILSIQVAHAQTRKEVYDQKLKLECYEMRSATSGRSHDGNDPMMFKTTKAIFNQAVHFRCTRKIILPHSTNQFLAAMFRQSDTPGIPIEKEICRSDGSIDREFWTTALYQKHVFSDFFAYPKNFKVVDEHSMSMYVSSNDKGHVIDLLKGWILEAPKDKKDGISQRK